MPIHLDPLSRRRFLGQSAILTAGALAPSLSRGEAASRSWALLADTHIAADPDLVSRQGVNMADHLRRVVAELVEEKDTLAGVLIDGDCAYLDGQPGDYTTLLELLAPLEEADVPVHFTLGNHDNRDTFREACEVKAETSPVESKHCSVIETPEADWILLDSLRYVNKVEGEIGEAQLNWIAKRLRENPDRPALLIGHHYPQVFRTDVIPADEPIKISGLVDSEPFLEMLGSHPAAKGYIYGHSHNWSFAISMKPSFPLVNLPPTAYVFNPDRPSGWVRATLSDSGVQFELRSLDPEHPQHGQKHKINW